MAKVTVKKPSATDLPEKKKYFLPCAGSRLVTSNSKYTMSRGGCWGF